MYTYVYIYIYTYIYIYIYKYPPSGPFEYGRFAERSSPSPKKGDPKRGIQKKSHF